MSLTRNLFLALLMFSLPCFASAEELTPKMEKDIRALLELTDAANISQQFSEMIVSQMTDMVGDLQPEMSAKVLRVMRDEINSVLADQLPLFIDQMVPVYARYFTHKEIQQLTKFYKTDAGKKTVAAMPSLMRESMTKGQKWGETLAPVFIERLGKRLAAEGIELKTDEPKP